MEAIVDIVGGDDSYAHEGIGKVLDFRSEQHLRSGATELASVER